MKRLASALAILASAACLASPITYTIDVSAYDMTGRYWPYASSPKAIRGQDYAFAVQRCLDLNGVYERISGYNRLFYTPDMTGEIKTYNGINAVIGFMNGEAEAYNRVSPTPRIAIQTGAPSSWTELTGGYAPSVNTPFAITARAFTNAANIVFSNRKYTTTFPTASYNAPILSGTMDMICGTYGFFNSDLLAVSYETFFVDSHNIFTQPAEIHMSGVYPGYAKTYTNVVLPYFGYESGGSWHVDGWSYLPAYYKSETYQGGTIEEKTFSPTEVFVTGLNDSHVMSAKFVVIVCVTKVRGDVTFTSGECVAYWKEFEATSEGDGYYTLNGFSMSEIVALKNRIEDYYPTPAYPRARTEVTISGIPAVLYGFDYNLAPPNN